MKKSERKLLSENLDKALAPPARRKPALASHLADYNDEQPAQVVAPDIPLSPSDGQTPSVPLSTTPIAPTRRFNRRANSIDMDALPAGLFPGSSQKIYNALYVRTRGAVVPTRTVRATKRELAQWAGVKNRKTLDGHMRYLATCRLIVRQWELGNNEGYLFEVNLPEEVGLMDRGGSVPLCPSDPSDQKREWGTDQKRDTGGQSKVLDSAATSGAPKTSYKTNTDDDDEGTALSGLSAIFCEATRQLTRRELRASEREQWTELARVLVAELNEAAARADAVSSVPAFLAAHLKRRFARPAGGSSRAGKRKTIVASTDASNEASIADPGRRLTPEEIGEQAQIIAELLVSGYTIEQAEEQFARSLHAEDWAAIRTVVAT